MRGALRVVLSLALAATSIAYFAAERRVTLAYDGREETLTTFASTVEEALDRAGVEVGPDDLVIPSPAASLPEVIEVRRAKDVIIVLNGEQRIERVTGSTVEQILEELQVGLAGAYLNPSAPTPISDGEAIVVAQPVKATVIHDGIEQPVVTNVLTAGALLRRLGISLGPLDRVEPSIIAYPGDGPITIVRVNRVMDRVEVPIPYRTVTRETDDLDHGTRKVAQTGRDGVRLRVYQVIYENGRVKSRVLVNTEVLRQPRNEVVLVGNRSPSFSSTGGVQYGEASWYWRQGYTAAHKTLPFGTVVKVTNLANGRTVTVTIDDRGPFVEGRIIDLSDDAFKELAPLSTGVIDVKIEW